MTHARFRVSKLLAALALAAAAGLASPGLPAARAVAAAQQPGTVTGRVVEAGSRQPVPGAQITVEGMTVGAIAGDDGSYVLSGLPSGPAVVRVEMAGFAPVEKRVPVLANRPTRADFALEAQVFQLDEIVVTGTAGSARQREVAHSVDQIVLENVDEPVADFEELLAGRVPGLTVLEGSGMLGSASQIRLRGNVSLALSNQPLVYVDGVRIRSDGYPRNSPPTGDPRRGPNDVPSPLGDINVDDIERVEVVKGPAATTLYGAEAASGVIQIFTKRGTAGRTSWTARVDQGVDDLQAFGTDEDPHLGLDPWLRDGWRQRYGGSIGGGGGAVRYFASTVLDQNEGVLPNDEQGRLVLRANADASPLPGLDLAWSSSFTVHDLRSTASGNNAHGLVLNAFRGPRNFLADTSKAALDQLLAYDITTDIEHLIAGVTTTWAPSDRLSQRLTLGYDRAALDLRQLRPFGFVLAPGGILSDEDWTSWILTLDYAGSWVLPLREDLRTTVSWGGQNVTTDVHSEAGYAETFSGPGKPGLDSGALRLDFESRTRVANGGVFAQALLDWRDRWFVTAGLRLDGSSAFGEELGLQPYPRVGLSYVISDEPFWPSTGRLKLRSAYGHAGRLPGAFDAVRTWANAGFDGDSAFVPNKIGNPELEPERTAELELGFEGAFLDERLVVDATWFNRNTTDALFPVTQIPTLGFLGTQLENVGRLRTRGVELAVDGTVIRSAGWEWDLGAALATNHSEILDLGGAAPLALYEDLGWLEEGQPAPVVRGLLITNEDEIAEPDLVEDHAFGPNIPTTMLQLRTAFRLPGGLRLSARGEYLGGHFIADRTSRTLQGLGVLATCVDAYAAFDAGERDRLTAWERFWCDRTENRTDTPIYSADYFRLRDVTVEVPLPGVLLRSAAATLTLSARNLVTWKNDDIRLFDPEMAGHGGVHVPFRVIEFQVPPTSGFTVSLRAVH